MSHVPVVQFLDIRDAVDLAPFLHGVGVFAEETVVDYSPAMVGVLEMGVWEADEYFLQLVRAEVIGEVTHRVGSQDRYVVAGVLLDSVGPDFLADEIDHLVSNLESDGVFTREELGKRD